MFLPVVAGQNDLQELSREKLSPAEAKEVPRAKPEVLRGFQGR